MEDKRTFLELQTVSLVSNLLAPITSNVQTYSCSESQRDRLNCVVLFYFQLMFNSESLGQLICILSRSILSRIDPKVAPLREPDKNLWGEIEQLADRSEAWTFIHRSLSLSLSLSTSQFECFVLQHKAQWEHRWPQMGLQT